MMHHGDLKMGWPVLQEAMNEKKSAVEGVST